MSLLDLDIVSRSPRLRSMLRKSGVTRIAALVRPILSRAGYEARVDEALTRLLRPGDCVWDVGANVGVYTERFSQQVGRTGVVVGFEPIARTFAALTERVAAAENVKLINAALGAGKDVVRVALHEDPTSPTNSLMRTTDGLEYQQVHVESGDELIASGRAQAPTVLKIDTEGFEEEVLWGLRSTLRAPNTRALLIEVHFALLEARGLLRAPERIASMLDDAGFRLRWVDASHLLAERSA